MTTLEINKKIASMRKHDGIDDGHPFSNKNNRLYNWAENIADAWELFEELDGQIITEDRYSGTYSGGKWLCTYETLCPEEVLINGPQAGDTEAMEFWENPLLVVSAATAPLAICKAWLAWKENKK